MRLTHYTDYALRVLIYLAVDPAPPATISGIAERYRIARPHVVKVVHRLGQLGYIHTQRGRHGGLTLARPPESIVIGEVVRHMETNLQLVECFDQGGSCVISPSCTLRQLLAEALENFLAVLDRHTLADLSQPRAPLQNLLGLQQIQ